MPKPTARLLARDAVALSYLTLTLARQAVIADIETNCFPVALPQDDGALSGKWWDTRPMLDPREQPDQAIDMARQSLDWAEAMDVITRHPDQTYLVLIEPQDPFKG